MLLGCCWAKVSVALSGSTTALGPLSQFRNKTGTRVITSETLLPENLFKLTDRLGTGTEITVAVMRKSLSVLLLQK